MPSSIFHAWTPEFRALYGGEWPKTYCAFDIETSGFSPKTDLILSIGHTIVIDDVAVECDEHLLCWPNSVAEPDWWTWLDDAIYTVNKQMRKDAREYPMTVRDFRERGEDALDVLFFYLDLFKEFRKSNFPIVLHNGYNLDERFFKSAFPEFLNEEFDFGDNWMLDTAAIEKVIQRPDEPKMWPKPGDTLRKYFVRVNSSHQTGVYSNLDTHCWQKYNFKEKSTDFKGTRHLAGFDSYLCHLLMREFREQIEYADAHRPPPPPPSQRSLPETPRAAAPGRPSQRKQRKY